jgi:hypothetical protein
VSLGAEVVALDKDVYCTFCSKEGREVSLIKPPHAHTRLKLIKFVIRYWLS